MSAPHSQHEGEVRRWLDYAWDELAAAETWGRDLGIAPHPICFMAQQAAEKVLKASLCFLQIEIPKIHDLDRLCGLLPDGWTVKEKYPRLGVLSGWAIQARYPGDWPDATNADVSTALIIARGVVETICADLKKHGFKEDEENEKEG